VEKKKKHVEKKKKHVEKKKKKVKPPKKKSKKKKKKLVKKAKKSKKPKKKQAKKKKESPKKKAAKKPKGKKAKKAKGKKAKKAKGKKAKKAKGKKAKKAKGKKAKKAKGKKAKGKKAKKAKGKKAKGKKAKGKKAKKSKHDKKGKKAAKKAEKKGKSKEHSKKSKDSKKETKKSSKDAHSKNGSKKDEKKKKETDECKKKCAIREKGFYKGTILATQPKSPIEDAEGCCGACEAEAKCEGWHFVAINKKCTLLEKLNTAAFTSQVGSTAGVKPKDAKCASLLKDKKPTTKDPHHPASDASHRSNSSVSHPRFHHSPGSRSLTVLNADPSAEDTDGVEAQSSMADLEMDPHAYLFDSADASEAGGLPLSLSTQEENAIAVEADAAAQLKDDGTLDAMSTLAHPPSLFDPWQSDSSDDSASAVFGSSEESSADSESVEESSSTEEASATE